MMASHSATPPTLGLFEKRFDGDDSLIELARRRFHQTALGAEMHAGSPEQLEALLRFRPSAQSEIFVHLPRDLGLLSPTGRQCILDLARRFAGRVRGLVLHDEPAMATRQQDYRRAAWDLDDQFERIDRCPMLFIEYAAGLDPAEFVAFFEATRDLDRIGACLDTGHVGIRETRTAYARVHGGEDVCALKTQPQRLPELLPEIEVAVSRGAAVVLELIEKLAALSKPVHFHLHDGHPLSSASPFGVSDHLGFTARIPLPFEYQGSRTLPGMYGPKGLARIVACALQRIPPRPLSFTLEIHPTYERRQLGDAADLFGHWRDKTNAEMMNHWLWVLTQNHHLLRQIIQQNQPTPAPEIAPSLLELDFVI